MRNCICTWVDTGDKSLPPGGEGARPQYSRQCLHHLYFTSYLCSGYSPIIAVLLSYSLSFYFPSVLISLNAFVCLLCVWLYCRCLHAILFLSFALFSALIFAFSFFSAVNCRFFPAEVFTPRGVW